MYRDDLAKLSKAELIALVLAQAAQIVPRDLELAVIDGWGPHTVIFPCRRVLHGWIKAGTEESVNVHPTHWREWDDS